MSTIGWIIVAIIWIAIAFWPARVAGRKGHSFFGYFVFSLVFFPLALLMAYMVQDRKFIGLAEAPADDLQPEGPSRVGGGRAVDGDGGGGGVAGGSRPLATGQEGTERVRGAVG